MASARRKAAGIRELWLSTADDKSATRFAGGAKIVDHRLRIVYSYDSQAKLLYRYPAVKGEIERSETFLNWFRELFRGNAKLQGSISNLILIDQHRRRVQQAGREVDILELHFDYTFGKKYFQEIAIVVDPKNHLPESMTVRIYGYPLALDMKFEYPQSGPAVFTLGVPRDAKLVDRVPSGNFAHVFFRELRRATTGSTYLHAIVVSNDSPELLPGPEHKIWNVFLVWEKGIAGERK